MDDWKLEITIKPDVIIEAVDRAVTTAFQPGSSYDRGGKAYEYVRAQVDVWARHQDWEPAIKRAAPAIIDTVLADVIRAAAEKEVKARIKAMSSDELKQLLGG